MLIVPFAVCSPSDEQLAVRAKKAAAIHAPPAIGPNGSTNEIELEGSDFNESFDVGIAGAVLLVQSLVSLRLTSPTFPKLWRVSHAVAKPLKSGSIPRSRQMSAIFESRVHSTRTGYHPPGHTESG